MAALSLHGVIHQHYTLKPKITETVDFYSSDHPVIDCASTPPPPPPSLALVVVSLAQITVPCHGGCVP